MIDSIKKYTCPICDEAKLFEKKGNRTVPTALYADAWMAIGDDEVLKFGLCKNCLKDLDEEKCKYALERFKIFWRSQPKAGKLNKKKYRCHDSNRDNCVRKLLKYKEKKHKEMLKKRKK